ncbi:MAG TPA: sulfite exporter TauE/SafE family protein [Mycobacteriales bacterium]|nr:sulfite exporter TauE/SafE family protein [Mycobacteriales bacterium]
MSGAADVGTAVLVLLALFGFVGGVGITALGPGGVLVTIGLFACTDLSPGAVAGTAIVTHIATGLMGTAAYARSGQLREPEPRRTAAILSAAAVAGAPIGVVVNGLVSGQAFGILLGLFVAVVAVLVWVRDRRAGGEPGVYGTAPLAALGFAVAAASGLFGVGGPMLTVPLLICLGAPVLGALAAAQAQSVVIATVGSIGYLVQGQIDWRLALLVGIPEVGGVLIGWKIARSVPTRGLKYALITALLVVAPYLAFHG